MKRFHLLIIAVLSTGILQAQEPADSTGLPGDDFSLAGAIELFKNAASPEDFEKRLNAEGNDVNNLDLNGDGEVDYIKVIDRKDGNAHALVLQVPVTESENQDIAVIEIEKNGESSAILQIVGDEDIFGETVIVEPGDDQQQSSFLFRSSAVTYGSSENWNDHAPVIVNVWLWPSIRFMYAPAYVVWRSPWAWRARPIWWRPWRPLGYAAFYPRRVAYRPRYVVVHTHRVTHAHRIYRPARVTSVTVRSRHQVAHSRYKVSRRTTVIEGPRGNKMKRTKTTVRRRRG